MRTRLTAPGARQSAVSANDVLRSRDADPEAWATELVLECHRCHATHRRIYKLCRGHAPDIEILGDYCEPCLGRVWPSRRREVKMWVPDDLK